MAALYYSSLFIASVILTIIYATMWNKRFDVHFTLMFAFIPVVNLGFLLQSQARSLDTIITGIQLSYLGGCYLLMFITMCIFSLCGIKLSKTLTMLLYSITTIVYLSTFTIGYTTLFYKNLTLTEENGSMVVHKEYGTMHHLFTMMVVAYFGLSLCTLIYSYSQKKDVSRKIIYLMFLPEVVAILCFYGGRAITRKIELLPAAYVFAQVMYLLIAHRVGMYDITDTGIDSIEQKGDIGFISFDNKYNYLGSNETAQKIFPELKELRIDKPICKEKSLSKTALKWIEDFEKESSNDKIYYKSLGKVYLVDVHYLYINGKKRGYHFFLTDDTLDQQYIMLLNRFNSDLKEQVEQKTQHIVEMHDNLILGMATMVESRDNSTGGHIRRTSDVVRILVTEMLKRNELGLSAKFCKNLIKSAPMHDLGKIAVDDAILRKPGRFTPEEFEKMKSHADEGARIVNEILKGTDNVYFHKIAQSVAHYHHERWDGSGYPKGLKGEQIPLEARIMAIADVYDALVSKRVYKESMSFEKADEIIMDSFGKHFDERLKPYYVSARPKLEEYYRKEQQLT